MLVCERNNLLDAIIYIHNTAIQASSQENSLGSLLILKHLAAQKNIK